MGLANRITSRIALVVCVAFPNLMRRGSKYRLTGNPIRPEITQGDPKEGFRVTGFKKGLPVLLVWGGSQGSAQINGLIEKDFEKFTEHFQIVHIVGAGKAINKKSPNYVQLEYLNDELKHVYAIADMVIGRAGANSLYEIATLKKPNIIIPLGNADQLGNAAYFEEMGAGIVYKKAGSLVLGAGSTANGGRRLFDLALNLWQNQTLRHDMEASLGKISANNATAEIVKIILGL